MATTDFAAAIDTGELIMSYAKEAVWGTLPAVAFKAIRLDGEGFSSSKQRSRPNEIDSSGQASQAITVKEESTGSLDFSVSAGTHNDLVAASLGADWNTAVSITGTNIAAVVDGFTGTGFDTSGLVPGQWVKVSGFTGDALNNDFYQVLTVAATKITTAPAPHGLDAAGESVTIKGQMLRNGSEFQSFFFQKQLAADKFLRYAGAWPTGGSFDVGVGDYLKGKLSFINKSEVKDIIDASTGAIIAAPTGTVVDSINGIKNILWNGTAIAAPVQKLGVKWNKEGARAQYALGSASAMGMGKGKLKVDGSLSTYFKDFTLFTAFKDETAGVLCFRAIDSAGKGYIITLCKANIMNPKIVAGQANADFMADFEVEAAPGDATLYGGKTIQIDYFS